MAITDSILDTIKSMLPGVVNTDAFDTELIIHINTVLNTLKQLGVGPSDGFMIDNPDATWADFLEDEQQLQQVKSYMYLRVRLLFDPPNSSTVLESFKEQIKEFEWRMNVEVETDW